MNHFRSAVAATAASMLLLATGLPVAAQQAPVLAWTPKPAALTPYTGPHRPHTRLSEVLAAHRGEASWRQVVVDDKHMVGAWVQAAPGERPKPRMFADHRYALIVWDGELRVSIEGQAPFVARKGFMVQVPYRTPYSIETVGDRPALYFETYPQSSATLYPVAETPPPAPPGTTWYRARLMGRDTYERQQLPGQPWRSRPYWDFFGNLDTVLGATRTVVGDDRMVVNIIRGKGVPRQPDTVKGHFHLEYAEFWLIAEGKVSYLIEGMPYFEAEPGDIVYVPPGRFHRAQWAGDGLSTRIAVNGYVGGSHHYDPDE